MTASVQRLYNARETFLSPTGVPYANARLFFYAAGTTTKQATYADSLGSSANTNPIVLNQYGQCSVEVWLLANTAYKVVMVSPGSDDPPSDIKWTEDSVLGLGGVGLGGSSNRPVNYAMATVFDFGSFTNAQITDILSFTGALDVTIPLNTAFAYAANNSIPIRMPAGYYTITDTLWGTPQGTAFLCAWITGDGGGYASGNKKTIINASAITSKPAINFQRVRGSYFGHIQIIGGNTALSSTYTADQLTYTQTYVGSGIRDDQYSPYCGIAIDAGMGATPTGGGYSGFSYQHTAGGTSGLEIDNVTIRQFVVGIMHDPEQNNASQGDGVTIINPTIIDCKVAIAAGVSQNRSCNVHGGTIGWCRSIMDTNNYGRQVGNPFRFFGTQFGPAFEILQINSTNGEASLHGCYAEEIHRIGQSGTGGSAGACPVDFTGSEFNLLSPVTGTGLRCPIVFEAATSPVIFSGCYIRIPSTTHADALNFVGEPTVFDSCTFIQMKSRFKPFIGGVVDLNTPAKLKDCRIHDGTGVAISSSVRRLSPPARQIRHWGDGPVLYGSVLYDVVPGAGSGENYINQGTASAFSFVSQTLTFTLSSVTNLMVNDILMWRINAIGTSVSQNVIPALKVTTIVGTTVTCDLLFANAYYDQTYAPSNIAIVVHEWAPGAAHTGDTTSGSPTVVNVTPTTVLQNGDWIKGTGIPANCRVTAGAGTATITLSQNATASNTGVSLYWGQFKTFTEAAAW